MLDLGSGFFFDGTFNVVVTGRLVSAGTAGRCRQTNASRTHMSIHYAPFRPITAPEKKPPTAVLYVSSFCRRFAEADLVNS